MQQCVLEKVLDGRAETVVVEATGTFTVGADTTLDCDAECTENGDCNVDLNCLFAAGVSIELGALAVSQHRFNGSDLDIAFLVGEQGSEKLDGSIYHAGSGRWRQGSRISRFSTAAGMARFV